MIGQTVGIGRGLLEVLGSLVGTQSNGYALVKASGADTLLPCGTYAAPVREYSSGSPVTTRKQIDRENLLYTTADAVVNSTGVLVPVRSMLGGVRQNIAAGIELRWDYPVAGVESVSEVATGGLAGGTARTAEGSVGQVIMYEELRPTSFGLDLFKARAESGAPAVVLCWDSSFEAARGGRGVALEPERWVVFIVVGSQAGGSERGRDGLDTLDAVAGLLHERASVAGRILSAPPATVLGRKRVAVSEMGYVYAVDLKTYSSLERITNTGLETEDSAAASPTEWEQTQYDLLTGSDDPTFPMVKRAVYPMLLDGHDDGFDDGFG